jgi:hypothetical protein
MPRFDPTADIRGEKPRSPSGRQSTFPTVPTVEIREADIRAAMARGQTDPGQFDAATGRSAPLDALGSRSAPPLLRLLALVQEPPERIAIRQIHARKMRRRIACAAIFFG